MINGDIHNRLRIWIKALHIALSFFIYGYSLGVFNPCLENISYSLSWNTSEKKFYSNLFSALVPVGALIGAIFTGHISSKIGRRNTIFIMDIVVIVGSGLSMIHFTLVFGIGRFIVGIGIGMCLTIAPLFIGESTPQPMMRSIGPCMSIFLALGLSTAYGFGLILPTSSFDQELNNFWMLMMGFPAFVVAYQGFVIKCFFKYDSPLHYLQKKKFTLYKLALCEIFSETEVVQEIQNISDSRIAGNNTSGVSFQEIFFNKKYRKMLRLGVIIASLQQFSGVNAIIFYSSVIFQSIGTSISTSRLITFFIGVTQIISNTLTIIILNRFGRKTALLSGHFMISIDLFLVGIFSQFMPENTIALAILICSFFIFFSYSLSATMWSYIGEIQNSKAISISVACNFLCNTIVVLVFPRAVDSIGLSVVFYFFAVCMIADVIYIAVDAIETKNKTKDEIEMIILKTTIVYASVRTEL